MAFPLKSGADLYNQQLIRAAIWNYSAEILDPKEYVTGLMYFNTNSGSNLYQKLRFRTGTEWKTIAFEEDLDVANNADFKALEDKVKLLAGEVDTDAIISNMKEVSNFLAGFAEDANLMSVLDGKLNKTGGTISSGAFDPLKIKGNSSYSGIGFERGENKAGYLVYTGDVDWFVTNEGWGIGHKILHAGNIGEYAICLDKSATGSFASPSKFNTVGYGNGITSSGWHTIGPILTFGVSENFGQFQKSYDGDSLFLRSCINGKFGSWKTIAFTDSNVASATKLATPRTIWGQSFDGTGDVSGNLNLNLAKLIWHGDETYSISCPNTATSAILQYAAFDGHLFKSSAGQVMLINSSGNVGIGTMTNISSLLTLAASTTEEPTIAVDDHCKILGISNKKNDWGSRTILESGWNSTIGDYLYLRLPSSMANSSYLFMQRENGGRFGVDTNAPQAKFHVAGDIVANGTIACKGIAAEGDAMDMVDKTVLYIIPNGTQQTFTLNHGLGTREITISIYEITSMGTNMILTDVEIVDDNNISVSFGNPPTDNHMVVVMG